MKQSALLGFLLAWGVFGSGCGSKSSAPTATKSRVVTNTYHGAAVADPFQWLENTADAEVVRWVDDQTSRTRKVFDSSYAHRYVEARLNALLTTGATNYSALQSAKGMFFALKFVGALPQPLIVSLTSSTNLSSERTVLDPNTLDAKGSIGIEWFKVSPDASMTAVCLSQPGTPFYSLYFYKTESGEKLLDVLPRVGHEINKGSLAWSQDSSGVFYTRFPGKTEANPAQQGLHGKIYYHKMGSEAASDSYELGNDFPSIAKVNLSLSPRGDKVLASIRNGESREACHYVRFADGTWTLLAHFEDRISKIDFGREPIYLELPDDDAFYLLSFKDAPKGQVLRLPVSQTDISKATVAFAESTNVIHDFVTTASGLGMIFGAGDSMHFAFLDFLENSIRHAVSRETVPESVHELVVAGGDELLYGQESYHSPLVWWRYNASKNKELIEPTAIAGTSAAKFDDVEVIHITATSADGSLIPVSILMRRGTRLDGNNPAILAISESVAEASGPHFDPPLRAWLDQGGIYANASLRGPGDAVWTGYASGIGRLATNRVEDLLACVRQLLESQFTSVPKLSIVCAALDASVAAALLAQHPELFGAAVLHSGVFDLLRAENLANGSYTTPELGSIKSKETFESLRAYSPYHRVKPAGQLPAIFLAAFDPQNSAFSPAHSFKMAARLQSVIPAGAATFFAKQQQNHRSGRFLHGLGAPGLADVFTFLFDRLGVDYSLVDRGPWVGAVTPKSAVVKARLVQADLDVKLVLSQNPTLQNALVSVPHKVAEDRHNLVEFELKGLNPDTLYYYAFSIDGKTDNASAGTFKTFPAPGPASFSFAFASCARTSSTNEVFDVIRKNKPYFFMNTGDFHYLNIATNDIERFYNAYDTVLASIQQRDLYRHVPFVYVWDDHDFGGNNSDKRSKSELAARLAYESYVPHYPLTFEKSEDPISQSFSVGRVKFIVTDLRSQRDDPKKREGVTKSMMGVRQKEWFKKELLAAKGKFPMIVWVSSVPWIGAGGTNYYHWVKTNEFGYFHHTNHVEAASYRPKPNEGKVEDDSWGEFRTERRELADFIKENNVTGVCIVHGDSHMLAADDGTHSDYATGGGLPLPVMCAAPLDQEASLKGGYYSQGVYRVRKGEGCFGLITVTDHGNEIEVHYSGRNNRDEEKISLDFKIPTRPEVHP